MTPNEDFSGSWLRPLIAIFAMQSVIMTAFYALPVIIPAAAADLGIDPDSVGFYIGITYSVSMIVGVFASDIIRRLGPTNVFRLMLLFAGCSAIALASGHVVGAIAAAMIMGCASGPMNPTGSYVLARVTPDHRRGFVFSLKQCATPAGGIIAGAALPPLMLIFGWQKAMYSIPLAVLIIIGFAGFGRLGGIDSANSAHKFSLEHALSSMRKIIQAGPIRSLTTASVCLAAAQMGLTTYLVVYLWREVGLSEAQAGLVFAALHTFGVISRVVLGIVADKLPTAKWILVGVCVVLAISLAVMARFDAGWPLALIYAVVAIAGATGNGWVGLYYAELARLSKPDEVAEIAGASQFFSYFGLVAGPTLFGVLLAITNSYSVTLYSLAGFIFTAGLYLALTRER